MNYPLSSPSVISIGGTTLNMVGNKRSGEYVWADPDVDSGSGKGISALFAKPAYQLTNASANKMTPDMSLVANTPNELGVVIVYAGEAYGVAGTSLSCPLFAGMLASGLSYNKNAITQSALMTNLYALANNTSLPFNAFVDGIGSLNSAFIGFVFTMA